MKTRMAIGRCCCAGPPPTPPTILWAYWSPDRGDFTHVSLGGGGRLGYSFGPTGAIFSTHALISNVQIPRYATVTSSICNNLNALVATWGPLGATARARIYSHAVDNGVAATSWAEVNTWNRTTAFTTWNPVFDGSQPPNGGFFSTPDFSNVIQEIVNRPGWTIGNAISLLIDQNGSTPEIEWRFNSTNDVYTFTYV